MQLEHLHTRATQKGTGVIPIGDENPTRRTPVVTMTLVILNVIVFVLQLLRGIDFTLRFSFVPLELTALLEGRGSLWVLVTVFTAMFLHGSFGHIFGNMLFLWIFGDNVEDVFGRVPYVLFYLLCGIAATMTQYLTGPLSPIPNLGASGAISGVLGAYVLMFPAARVNLFIWPFSIFFGSFGVPAFLWIGFWFLMQLFLGVQDLGQITQGGVAFWAHIGGFVAGLALTLLMPRRRRRAYPVQRTYR